MTPRAGYAICGQPRSGSTYFSHLLRSTGVLGKPYEIFVDAKLARHLHSNPAEFDALLARATTENGIYGFKVFSKQYEITHKLRWAERLPGLHFVYLEREDLLGQAISLSRAIQTQQFKLGDPAQAVPRYDRRLIADCIATISYGIARWKCFFARNDIHPLSLTYESVVRDPQQAVTALAGHIGLAPPPLVNWQEVDVRVQRDALSDDWRRRFTSECGDLGYLDGGMAFSGRPGGGLASRLFLGPAARHRRRTRPLG